MSGEVTHSDRRWWRGAALQAACAFVVLLCIVYRPLVFGDRVLGSPDTLTPGVQAAALKAAERAAGELALWQPWQFCGMPTTEAFSNLETFYFPNQVHRFLPLNWPSLQLFYLFLGGVGTFLLLRHFHCSKWPAILGGAAFLLNPYLAAMVAFGHGSQLVASCYIPWIVWVTVRLWRRSTLTSAACLALLLGFQLQAAHPQIAYYTWLFIGGYSLLQAVIGVRRESTRSSAARALGLFSGAVVVGAGIAMLIYLPAFEYARYSIRGAAVGDPSVIARASRAATDARYGYATSWSFHPLEALTFVVPSAFGFGGGTYWGRMPFTDHPHYTGVIVLALAIIGLLHRRDSFRWFLTGASATALVISFGRHFGVLYDLCYRFLPFFRMFRVPSMILILVEFGVLLLGSLGLDALIRHRGRTPPIWFRWGVGCVVASVLVLTIGSSVLTVAIDFPLPKTAPPGGSAIAPWTVSQVDQLRWMLLYGGSWRSVALLAAFLGGAWLRFRGRLSRQATAACIALLAIVDVAFISQMVVMPQEHSKRASGVVARETVSSYHEHDDVTLFLASDSSDFRIHPVGELFRESRFAMFGLESVGGYHPARLAVYENFLRNTHHAETPGLSRMLSVKYILASKSIRHPNLRPVFSGRLRAMRGPVDVIVHELQNPLPRAWFVDEMVAVADDGQLWPQLMRSGFDPGEVAYVPGNVRVPGQLTKGEVLEFRRGLHRISVKTRSAGPAFLVLSEVYYPLRWRALVDGRATPMYRTNGVLRGVLVSGGDHVVEFVLDRSSFRRGQWLSGISFVVAVCALVIGTVREGLLSW